MQNHQLSRLVGDSHHEAEIRVIGPGINVAVERGEILPGVLALHVAMPKSEKFIDAPRALGLRSIDLHRTNAANEAIDLEVLDEPGSGGASHYYRATVWRDGKPIDTFISFQNGGIDIAGPNGLTQEVLLAIVIDRLESFQRGPFKCKDNEDALAMIKGGLTCLQKRTKARVEQGVEGTESPHVEEPHDGKLRLDGRPFAVPAIELGYDYIPVEEMRKKEYWLANTEWFDTDNGQWWSTNNTLVDWKTVGAFRSNIESVDVASTPGEPGPFVEAAREAQQPTAPAEPVASTETPATSGSYSSATVYVNATTPVPTAPAEDGARAAQTEDAVKSSDEAGKVNEAAESEEPKS